MPIISKEIVIILIGIFGSALLLIIQDYFSKNSINIENPLTAILTIILASIVIILILYRKMREVNEELKEIKLDQQKLEEKLKIYKDISNIKERLNRLEEKNG